ncbi:MAG: hypothetical protein HC822_05535 [Oscillochloris sp.]|nr:hypothetical protein [Oscillochloris sp.]
MINGVAFALVIIGLSVAALGLGLSPRGRVPALSRSVRAVLVLVGLLMLGGGGVLASRPAPTPQGELRGGGPTALPAPTLEPVAFVLTPDVRGLIPAEATASLQAAGMALGQSQASCRGLGAAPLDPLPPAGAIVCQSPAPGVMAAVGVPVAYVLMR